MGHIRDQRRYVYPRRHSSEYPISDVETKKIVKVMRESYPQLKRVRIVYNPTLKGAGHSGTAVPSKIWICPSLTEREKILTLVHEAKHIEQFRRGLHGRCHNPRCEREAMDAEQEVRKLFADSDKDGVPNVFDCAPNDPRRQGKLFRLKYRRVKW